MSKYKALFIEETRDHLAELSRLMVQLESSRERAPVINDIFRRVHSIKGMAASMAYDSMATLAHRTEDLVGACRAGKQELAPETVDLLLRGVDALTQQLEAVAGDLEIPSFKELAEQLGARSLAGAPGAVPATSTPAPERAAAAPTKAAAAPPTATPLAEHEIARLVRVTVDPSCKAPGVRLFMVHRKLNAHGTVTHAIPTVDEMRQGQVRTHEGELTFVGGTDEGALLKELSAIPEIASVTMTPIAMPPLAPRSEPEPARAPEPSSETAKGMTTVRVRTDILDNLIDNVGELFILRSRFESLLGGDVHPEVRASLDSLSARIREVHDQVMAVRMTPMRTLTDRYPRLVRDLARGLNKEVELEVRGSEIELDRAVLENLDEPFVHTLRNAVDHGIEAPAEREACRKPRAGKVTISASRDRDMVLVVIEDDGRGLEPQRLIDQALRLGLISEKQAANLSAREAYYLICLPRFSTKSEVSGVSGRGVGMDAVRARIESLGGTLDIEAESGHCTRFIFRLPLTVAIINVLLVEAAQRVFALPVAKVVAVRETAEDTIRESSGAMYLNFRHALAPVVNLARLMKLPQSGTAGHAVLLEDGRDLVALTVDRVVGYREVVVKPLGEPLDRLDWFSGATILGDGQPILILDLPKALRPRLSA